MMKGFIWVLFALLNINIVLADVVLTEVMYNPSTEQGTDTDAEWVELYNNGTETIDLSKWKINGMDFDDVTLLPGEFVVIASELIDTSDADNDSFEAAWGNNDGIWNELDGNYKCIDSSALNLGNTNDTINLTNGIYEELFYYTNSLGADGNGKTLQKIDINAGNDLGNWNESNIIGGTPGRDNFAAEEHGLATVASIENTAPTIDFIEISPDDDVMDGVQILPELNGNKTVAILVEVSDNNGADDITSVTAEFNGEVIELSKTDNLDLTTSRYNGSFNFVSSTAAGNHTINITAKDAYSLTSRALVFECLAVLSFSLSSNTIDFGSVEPGNVSAVYTITVENNGNAEFDLELSGTDLVNGNKIIGVNNVERLFSTNWGPLGQKPEIIDFNLEPAMKNDLSFRLSIPFGLKANTYTGSVIISALA